jgi:hypothetical protein
MPRYIEANDLVRAMTLRANRTTLGEITPPQLSYSEMLELVADAPTADVVPRERFDRVFGNLKAVLEERSEDKEEVAREIFEEIEKTVNACVVDESLFKPAYFEFRKFNEQLAELKKKYTGDQT